MELSAFAKTNTAARLRAAASRGALSHALILSGAGDRNAAAHYAAAALECTGTDKPCLACARTSTPTSSPCATTSTPS